jgi:hypothetical protein
MSSFTVLYLNTLESPKPRVKMKARKIIFPHYRLQVPSPSHFLVAYDGVVLGLAASRKNGKEHSFRHSLP